MISIEILLIILFILITIYSLIGYRASYEQSSLHNQFVIQKSISIVSMICLLTSIHLNSYLFLGVAEYAYKKGILGGLYSLGVSSSLIIWGLGFAQSFVNLKVITIPEIFSKHYQSYKLQYFTALISIISLCGILLAQIIAFQNIFIHIGIHDAYAVVMLWVLLIGYNMLIKMDILYKISIAQSSIIYIGLGIILYTFISSHITYNITVPLLEKMQWYYFNNDSVNMYTLPIYICPFLYTFIRQDMIPIIIAKKSNISLILGCIFSAIVIHIIAYIPLSFGILTKIENLTFEMQTNPFFIYSKHFLNNKLYIMMIVMIVMILTLAINSLLYTIHQHIALDIFKQSKMKNIIPLSKNITLLISCFITVVSFFTNMDMFTIMQYSYRLSTSTFLIPILMLYIRKKRSQGGALVATSIGLLSFIATQAYIAQNIWQDIIPLMLSLLGYIIGAILSEK